MKNYQIKKHIIIHIKNCNNNEKVEDIIDDVLQKYSVKDLSNKLDLSKSTVQRWIDNKKVPQSYQFDLLKLLCREIDYSKYTYKDKDQFFTPPDTAKYCYNTLLNKLKELKVNKDD